MVQKIVVNQKRQRVHSQYRAHENFLHVAHTALQQESNRKHNQYTQEMIEDIGEF